jgi:hypothetical protein
MELWVTIWPPYGYVLSYDAVHRVWGANANRLGSDHKKYKSLGIDHADRDAAEAAIKTHIREVKSKVGPLAQN